MLALNNRFFMGYPRTVACSHIYRGGFLRAFSRLKIY